MRDREIIEKLDEVNYDGVTLSLILEVLLDIRENLTKHNNDFKKVCPKCNGKGKYWLDPSITRPTGKWMVCDCSKPIPKS